MHIYDSIESFNAQESAGASAQGEGAEGWAESDWGYRLRGEGQPGGPDGGWMVVYLFEDHGFMAPHPNGWLIAYELGANNGRTGRVAVLRRNWTEEDDQIIKKAQQREEWDGDQFTVGGEADITWLDKWLPGAYLHNIDVTRDLQ